MPKTIALIVGSFREGSFNASLAKAITKLAGDKLSFTPVDIAALPHFSEDLEQEPPESVISARQIVASADGVMFVTPEYNRSYPGVVKNALDWLSRPYGQNIWSGKPATVTGASPGGLSAALAVSRLKADALHVDLLMMHQPEVYVQHGDDKIEADGTIIDEALRKHLTKYVDAFAAFVEKHG